MEAIANRLLLSLPQPALDRIMPALECVKMDRGKVISRADRPVDHLYFLNRGLVSLVKTMEDGRTVEIGVVGIEGVTEPHALFGSDYAPLDAIVQIPGTAFRVPRDALKRCATEDEALGTLLEEYSNFALKAMAQTAACNRLHHLEERCCRWLLIGHDSALADTFPLTHEFLAMMLGVQRAGVSIAAKFLQKAGLIQYRHGQVTITNRAGLEEAACECYREMHLAFGRVVGTAKK
jgi:CRP-like cAMP-binding protein